MSSERLFVLLTTGCAAALAAWIVIEMGTRWFERYRRRFTEHAHLSLRELFVFIDPGRLFVLSMITATGVGSGVWLLTEMPVAGVAAGVILALAPRTAFRILRQRRLERYEQQLPDALLVIAGGLRAGVSLTLALQQVVRESRPPISQEFDLLLREQRLGVSIDDALDKLAQRIPLQAMTLVVSAMRIANETGGSLAEALERAATTVRSQLAMQAKIRALTAQGKLQAIVVGLLPLALLLILGRMEPDAMTLMWSTSIGWATLATIALLEFFGVLLIRRIVTIDV
ncbi:MAG: type II secretion system F family protein [Thauera sp.]|nr:type II secretion system F family protein [Thauera sp.]